MDLTLRKVFVSCSINLSIVNITDIEVHSESAIGIGRESLAMEAKVDNGNAGETIVDPRSPLGLLMAKEGRGRQPRKVNASRPFNGTRVRGSEKILKKSEGNLKASWERKWT